MLMRRWLIALGVLSFGTVGSAMAADMPVKAPVAPVPLVFNWTGFYVGGYVGGA